MIFEAGQRVRIRDRHWEIVETRIFEKAQSLKVVGLDDDIRGMERTFIHPIDRIEMLNPVPLKWHIGHPGHWKDLHNAFLLTMVHGGRKLLSLTRGRLLIEDYQLEPVLKALDLPRQRLLIADDVGLGKTIEAGLILMELLARGRADRILIVTPASLQEQWCDEMADKFSIEFEIFDSKTIKELFAELPRGANPWNYRHRVVTSIDYVKRDDVRHMLRSVHWDVVIVDEAHYLAESVSGNRPVRTDRSRFGEFIASRCDSLLLLSATPHNGYSRGFYSLLRLIDPYLAPEEDKIYRRRIEPVLVRRNKSQIYLKDGTPKFRGRKVEAVPLDFTPEERDLYQAVVNYCKRQWKQAKSQPGKEAVGFAMTILKKRLLSSTEALRKSLQYRLENLTGQLVDLNAKKGLVADYKAGIPLTEKQQEKVEKDLLCCSLEQDEARLKSEKRSLKILINKANKVEPMKDSKARKLLEVLNDIFAESPEEKVIVFTEYRDTLNFLLSFLESNGYGDKIAVIHGSMNRTQRRQAEQKFSSPETRVLLATDAASEGINLQKYSHIVIHNELPWNPNRLEQRNGRVDRWGQDKEVRVLNLHLKESLESEILERLKIKMENIRRELGSASDVLGLASAVDIEEVMMESGGLKDDFKNSQKKLVIADKNIEKQLMERKKALERWKSQTLLRGTSFGQAQREQVQDALDETTFLLPDEKELEEFICRALEREGGRAIPLPQKGCYTLEVPPRYLRRGVQEKYEKATFSRELAVQDSRRQLEFLSPHHPLVQAVLQSVRSQLYNADNGDRMTYRVIGGDVEKGMLFTFLARYIDGNSELVEEKLLPVFVSIHGSPSYSEKEDLDLFRHPGIHRNVPPVLLETYRNRWEKLLAIARHVAKERMNQHLKRIQEQQHQRAEKLLADLEHWSEGRREYLKRELRPSSDLWKNINLFSSQEEFQRLEAEERRYRRRLEEELEILGQKVEERRIWIKQSRNIQAQDEPEILGALIIVPEEDLPAKGGRARG